MPDPFNDAAERHRQAMAAGYGSSPHNKQDLRFPGHYPVAPGLIKMSDFTSVNSLNPTTNYHSSPDTIVKNFVSTAFPATSEDVQHIYRADSSFGKPDRVTFPGLELATNAAFTPNAFIPGVGGGASVNMRGDFFIILLNVDLSVGATPYGLDVLDYDTIGYPTGSLYADTSLWDGPFFMQDVQGGAAHFAPGGVNSGYTTAAGEKNLGLDGKIFTLANKAAMSDFPYTGMVVYGTALVPTHTAMEDEDSRICTMSVDTFFGFVPTVAPETLQLGP